MKRKLVVIGPKSTHVDRFIHLVTDGFDDVVFIGEDRLLTDSPVRQYRVNFRSGNLFTQWRSYRRMRRILKAERPDVVHVQQVNRVAFLAARISKSLRLKLVVTAWGSDVLLIPKKNFLYRWITRYVLKKAVYITADSKEMMRAIAKLAPNIPQKLVMFGIDPLGNSPKEKLIYSNRALYPIYGLQDVVAEFAVFSKTHPDWKLLIAGTGSEEKVLKEQVQQLGLSPSVEFCGWLSSDRNEENYKKAALYVSLPISDGTSVSLLEAMSAGCIPVLSDLPVSQEWVEHGVNGIIKRASSNAFSEALQLNQSDVARINSKIIAERATREISAQRFSEIYDEI